MKKFNFFLIFILLLKFTINLSASEIDKEKLSNYLENNNSNEAIDYLLNFQNNLDAQYYLGYLYRYKLKDIDNALIWYEMCGEKGDVDCQYEAFETYLYDLDDLERSQYWLELCAQSNDIFCQNNLGYRYDNGIFVNENKPEAYKWFLKSADGGVSNAYTSIAGYYLDGEVVEQSYVKAFEYYQLGADAELGNPERALYGLALMHEKGLGTKVDYELAKKLYLQADKQGHELALLRKDALDGDIYSALYLAHAYQDGSEIEIGLPIDYEESAFFYKIAEFKGYGDASGFDSLIDIFQEKDLDFEWDKAKKRFEIWKSELGFSDPDSLDDITDYFLNHTGTGFYISPNLLMTNKHITYLDDEHTKKCDKLVGFDPYSSQYEEYESFQTNYLPKTLDVDFIYNPKSISFDTLTIFSEKPRLGEQIIALGFPKGDAISKYPKVTSGLIVSDYGYRNDPDEIIIDATSYGGSSGSPILNRYNQIVGILYSGPTFTLGSDESSEGVADPNLSYVVKSNYIAELLEHNQIKTKSEERTQNKMEIDDLVELNLKKIRFIECYRKQI